jgi:hypothetical protein
MPSPGPHGPLPYQECTDDAYAAAFAAGCVVDLVPRGLILRGTCPRCSEPMSFPHISTMVRSTVHGGLHPAEPFAVLCTCEGEHPGRPPSERDGCGAYWNLRISPDQP